MFVIATELNINARSARHRVTFHVCFNLVLVPIIPQLPPHKKPINYTEKPILSTLAIRHVVFFVALFDGIIVFTVKITIIVLLPLLGNQLNFNLNEAHCV